MCIIFMLYNYFCLKNKYIIYFIYIYYTMHTYEMLTGNNENFYFEISFFMEGIAKSWYIKDEEEEEKM